MFALRFVPKIALCLAPLILLALSSWAVAQTQFADVERSMVQLNKARLQDADTILGFAAEGAALYAAEPIKLTGYQYCSQAVSLAEAGEFRQSLRAASKALHLAVDSSNEDLLALAKRDLAIVMSYGGDLDKADTQLKALVGDLTLRLEIHRQAERLRKGELPFIPGKRK